MRATELDKVEIYKSFRPGDIVTAEVVRSPTYAFCKKKEYLMYNVPIYIYICIHILFMLANSKQAWWCAFALFSTND